MDTLSFFIMLFIVMLCVAFGVYLYSTLKGKEYKVVPIFQVNPRFLPRNPTMDTVKMDSEVYPIPKAHEFLALFCKHPFTSRYTRIDHRAGPGSWADNYEGEVCLKCGRIVREARTN